LSDNAIAGISKSYGSEGEMDVRQLRYFVSIAELGSVSAAAHRLGVAQPSLSQHVKHLEEELGVDLLIRSPRGVSLTESGQILLAHATSILNSVELAVTDIKERSGELKGAVSFGIPSSASNVLTVPLCETVQHEFPKIMLRTMEAMSGHVQEWLAQGQIDLGILYDIDRVRHLRTQPLLIEDLFLIVAPDSWSGKIGPEGIAEVSVTLRECADVGLIVPHRTHGLRETIERFANAQGVTLKVAVEMDSLTNIKALVSRGSGHSILAHAAVVDELQRGTLIAVPICEPVMRRTVYLVRNPSRPITQAVREIEKVINEIVAELVRKRVWPGKLIPS
jgi:LysR family nitrogen assimilation transcriptional regulator